MAAMMMHIIFLVVGKVSFDKFINEDEEFEDKCILCRGLSDREYDKTIVQDRWLTTSCKRLCVKSVQFLRVNGSFVETSMSTKKIVMEQSGFAQYKEIANYVTCTKRGQVV